MEKKVIDDILVCIQHILRFNNVRLTDEQIEYANERIIPYIEENVEIEDTKTLVFRPDSFIKRYGNQLSPVVVQYYAISQHNTDLLEKLNRKGFNFIGGHQTLDLFPLDHSLSSKFDEREYLKLLEKHKGVVKRFYYSVRIKEEELREKFIQDFADIVRADPTIMDVDKRKRKAFEEPENNDILTRRNMEWFDKDFLIHSTPSQRYIINSLKFNLEPENVEKLKAFLKKYPNHRQLLPFSNQILSFFSIDELGEMTVKDAHLYKVAFSEGLEHRIREVLSINPLFDCPEEFIREEIFRVIDDKTIAELTPQGLYDISNIKIPKVENAVVIPVRRINFAVFKDKRRVKKSEKQKEKSAKHL